MNKFIKKVIVGFTVATITFSGLGTSFAMPLLLHQDKESKNLSSGVVHEHIKQFHADGWWNINVLRVNLDDEYTKVDAMFSKDGISKTDTITNMMDGTNAVGGINADYFEMKGQNFAFGPTVSNGEIVGSPKYNDGSDLPAFVIDKDNNPFISYWTWEMKMIAPDGSNFPISAVNKPSSSEYSLAVYNDKWGGIARDKISSNIADLVIDSNGIVTDIRVDKPAISVPKDSQVISGRGYAKSFLINSFSIGSKADFKSTGNIDFDNVSAAVGGGSWLLKDGEKTKTNINITGNQPRTAVGISKDRRQLIMMTIDGRNSIFTGVSQSVLASIMKNLGAVDAINLDGGGSTTMAVKTREDTSSKVVNILSGGVERRVANGLGVFDSAPIGALHRLELSMDNKNIFKNTHKPLKVVGYDKYEHKLDVDLSNTVFSVEGVEGTFDANNFKALSAGSGKVLANLNGALGELQVNVLDNLREISFMKSSINLAPNGKHELGEIYGTDNRGVRSLINANDITYEMIGDIGKVENGIFYASETPSSGAIVAKLNDVLKTIPVSVGLSSKPVDDLEKLDGITTSVYPRESVGGSVSLDPDSKVGASSLKLNYDFTQTSSTRAFYAILGSGMKLEGNPTGVGLWINGNSDQTWVRGDITDANGKEFKLDFAKFVDWTGWKNVSAAIPEDAVRPLTLKRIYAAQIDPNNLHFGEMKLDGITGLYQNDVNVDIPDLPQSSVFKDEDNTSSEVLDSGFKFLISTAKDTAEFKSKLSESKLGFIMGGLKPETIEGLDTNLIQFNTGYKEEMLNGVKFVKVDNGNSGIRATYADQWLWMKSAIEFAQEKNIVVMLPKSIDTFKDPMEKEIFMKLMDEYKEMGKNMYLVYGGNKNNVELRDGIRYIEINTKTHGNGYEFTVNGDKVTYQLFQ